MASMALTQVYLDPAQKKALQRRAKERNSKVSEEIREAVDAHLNGVSAEELQLLDAASLRAQSEFKAMSETLRAVNKRLDALFEKIEHVRRANKQ
jgi:guanylate kinase